MIDCHPELVEGLPNDAGFQGRPAPDQQRPDKDHHHTTKVLMPQQGNTCNKSAAENLGREDGKKREAKPIAERY
ncbi:hypothetical protein EGI32_17000 [Ferruginibacter sp. HRS2-29]|nr:hypothetical protein [Ferruginibacter sp. HRS2-29]